MHPNHPVRLVLASECAHLLHELSARCTGHVGVWGVFIHPCVCSYVWDVNTVRPPDAKRHARTDRTKTPCIPPTQGSDGMRECSWGLWGRASTDAMPCRSWVPSSYFLVEPTLILIGCILICFDFCYLRMVGSADIFLWRLPSLLFGGYAEEFHWLTKCFICACCAEIILISNFGVFLFALDLLTNCLSFWEYTQDIRQTDISLNLRLLSMY